MTTIADIMTRDVTVARPDQTLHAAAAQMRDLDVGSLPVCHGDALVGIVTDRDIAIRGVAAAMDPNDARVRDVMTADAVSCRESDSVDAVLERMGDAQVRRIPVLDANGKVVGIVALGDMATRQKAPTDETLREISEPDAVE